MIEIVPATPEMLLAFYGERPRRSQRALAVLLDGKVVTVCGFYLDQARLVLFADIEESVRPLMTTFTGRRVVAKAVRRVMQMAAAHRLPIDSLADPKIDKSENLLEHIGFQRIMDRVYSWRPPQYR